MKKDELVGYLIHRYGTADPFQIAERLNVEIHWEDLGEGLLGRTVYMFGAPIILLNPVMQDTPKRYFVLAHEIGHVLLHAGLSSYYRVAYHGHDKAEYEANQFAAALMVGLYREDYDRLPDTYHDLECAFGLPPAVETPKI